MTDSADLSRLTAAIIAEIRWHSLEAVRFRQAAADIAGPEYEDEAWENSETARHHTETAERLHAILYPKEPQ